jgi:DNA-binding IscR family transcriptional regulator
MRAICDIHAVMRDAERHMQEALSAYTLADLAGNVAGKLPAAFLEDTKAWFQERRAERRHRARHPRQDEGTPS